MNKTPAANDRFCEMAGYVLVLKFCLLLQRRTRANVGVCSPPLRKAAWALYASRATAQRTKP